MSPDSEDKQDDGGSLFLSALPKQIGGGYVKVRMIKPLTEVMRGLSFKLFTGSINPNAC